ncbi:hypothetical protein PMI14_01372 [Acidovorax sp. CF316]|uniref:DUF4345 domain-containing protein n=1 Tax=Acidovorax sp. CF316 TaxID=1144317 RepID=UPI00026BCADB|nr:DUF4345 domain-containing protein [Acidovorax sp. CF316]EJE53731.1 hypothetical protein PMI14_01372 [Acidovorax sp. CF316]
MNRRLLQAATTVMALIPVVTGVLTMMGIDDPLYRASGLPRDALLDGNLRFFGGVWLALGLAMLSLVPQIEREGRMFAVLWGAVFLGGVGRALSMAWLGLPPVPFIGFTLLELVGAPAFIAWQRRVAACAPATAPCPA